MPLQDFLAGSALFALMLAPVVAATALVVRRRFGHLDRLELALASLVVGTAMLIGVHLVPLMLGVLTRGTVIAAALVALGLAMLVRPARPAPSPPAEPDPPVQPPPPATPPGRSPRSPAVRGGRPFPDLGRWAGDELVGDDPMTFHLPGVGRWIQNGTMWQIDQFVPLLAQGNYPNNGDVVLLSTVLPWHNDFLVRLPITFFLATTAVAAFAVARELRAPHAASLLAAAAVVSLPVVGFATIPRALPDSLMWATFACGILFLLRHARTPRRSDSCCRASRSVSRPGRSGTASAPSGRRGDLDGGAARGAPGPAATAAVLRDGVLVGGLALLGTCRGSPRNLAALRQPGLPAQRRAVRGSRSSTPRPTSSATRPASRSPTTPATRTSCASSPARSSRASAWRRSSAPSPSPSRSCSPGAAGARRTGACSSSRSRSPRSALLYTVTPATALGLRGDPSLAHGNTRYAVPALLSPCRSSRGSPGACRAWPASGWKRCSPPPRWRRLPRL